MAAKVLNLHERVRRSRGRASRTDTANAKVTHAEREELERAAGAAEKFLSEWAREVLLKAARGTHTERATFTEVVALRLLLTNMLKPGPKEPTAEDYEKLLNEIRITKHSTANALLQQYPDPLGGN